jgi:hypothetical protein
MPKYVETDKYEYCVTRDLRVPLSADDDAMDGGWQNIPMRPTQDEMANMERQQRQENDLAPAKRGKTGVVLSAHLDPFLMRSLSQIMGLRRNECA